MLALIQKGLPREKAYKIIQRNAMQVWKTEEDFTDFLIKDKDVTKFLNKNEISRILNIKHATRNADKIFKKIFKK